MTKPTPAGGDLFGTWLPALWTKARPAGSPPIFMMHRFLASDQDLAEAARVLQRDLRGTPDVAFRVWQGLLPKARTAPRFSYVAPKREPKAEALVLRIMEVEGMRRELAEEVTDVAEMTGKLSDLYSYYGCEAPK